MESSYSTFVQWIKGELQVKIQMPMAHCYTRRFLTWNPFNFPRKFVFSESCCSHIKPIKSHQVKVHSKICEHAEMRPRLMEKSIWIQLDETIKVSPFKSVKKFHENNIGMWCTNEIQLAKQFKLKVNHEKNTFDPLWKCKVICQSWR